MLLTPRPTRCVPTSLATLPPMSDIKTAIGEMYELMGKYSAYGASDTEPRGEFADILHDHLEGRDVTIPDTARGWQLFSSMAGADDVARILHDKAADVLRIANSDHRGFVAAMRYYF